MWKASTGIVPDLLGCIPITVLLGSTVSKQATTCFVEVELGPAKSFFWQVSLALVQNIVKLDLLT